MRDDRIIKGNFTLILYGGMHGDDIETVALLDREDDLYSIIPYAPEYHFTVKKHLPHDIALKEAKKFVRAHHDAVTANVSRIMDRNDTVIGYEVRPLYTPVRFGISDVLDINYVLMGNVVRVYVYVKDYIKDPFEQNRIFNDR